MITWRVKYPAEHKTIGQKSESIDYCEGDCLSSDQKPTDKIYNGSVLRELNTGKTYRFDADSGTWLLWAGGSGGGDSEDVATNSEVDEALDELFPTEEGGGEDSTPSGYIASDEDVSDALDELFPL